MSGPKDETRLTICRPSYRELAAVWDEVGGEEWQDGEHSEQWFLVIGTRTTDEKLKRLAHRFGLDAAFLIDFRDRPQGEAFEMFVHWQIPIAQGNATEADRRLRAKVGMA